jgi:hypothetical protein
LNVKLFWEIPNENKQLKVKESTPIITTAIAVTDIAGQESGG